MQEQLLLSIFENFDRLWSDIAAWLGDHLPNIIVILLGAYFLRRFSTKIITNLLERTLRRDLFPTEIDRKKRIETLHGLISATMRVSAWIIAAIMIVSEIGVNTAPLLASAGVLGVALGFGAQSLIKDFTSGIFIITENQYRVGDVVQLNQGVAGIVENVTIRTTVLRDLNGNLHHFPNGNITLTTNMTMEYANVNLNVKITYDSDLEKAEKIINEIGAALAEDEAWKDKIFEAPAVLRVDAFEESGIAIKVISKTVPMQQWAVTGELRKRLKKTFDKEGIRFALPQVVVHEAPHPPKASDRARK